MEILNNIIANILNFKNKTEYTLYEYIKKK